MKRLALLLVCEIVVAGSPALAEDKDAIIARLRRENKELRAEVRTFRKAYQTQRAEGKLVRAALARTSAEVASLKWLVQKLFAKIKSLAGGKLPPMADLLMPGLADLRNFPQRDYAIIGNPLGVGQVGQFSETIGVAQVIDKKNMLAVVYLGPYTPPGAYAPLPVRVRPQPPALGWPPTTIWIRNVHTAGIVDGASITTAHPFRICGTKRYVTTKGASRTVFMVEPLTTPARKPR